MRLGSGSQDGSRLSRLSQAEPWSVPHPQVGPCQVRVGHWSRPQSADWSDWAAVGGRPRPTRAAAAGSEGAPGLPGSG